MTDQYRTELNHNGCLTSAGALAVKRHDLAKKDPARGKKYARSDNHRYLILEFLQLQDGERLDQGACDGA